jgi:hypothetical protein
LTLPFFEVGANTTLVIKTVYGHKALSVTRLFFCSLAIFYGFEANEDSLVVGEQLNMLREGNELPGWLPWF